MSTPTPGPWRIRPIELYETNERSGIAIVGADGEVVCDNQTYYPAALAEKNAALIAAAPEMLAKIQTLIDTIEAVAGVINDPQFIKYNDPDQMANSLAQEAAEARALLTRIEGAHR